MSEFYIYDADRERTGILQDEESVQWLEIYEEPGEVKIVARATPDNIALLVDGNRIYNTDSDTAARIFHTDIEKTEAANTITARAKMTAAFLADRIVMATENITNAENGMRAIFQKNSRNIPLALAAPGGFTETIDKEITWASVLEGWQKISEEAGLGFKVVFDPDTGAETAVIYKGVDRSDENSPDYVGYFGTDVGNIKNVTISRGSSDYKNVAIVAGEGEGAARKVRIVSIGNPTGEERRELFVDRRDIQSTYQIATPTGQYDASGNPIYSYTDGTYTVAEYNALLDAAGMKILLEHIKDFSITCEIEQNNVVFNEDYYIGDRMPIKIPEYGVFASAVISQANRIYEKEGRKIVALLSDFEMEDS